MKVTFLISLAKTVRREHMLLSNLKNKAVIPQRHKIENTKKSAKWSEVLIGDTLFL